MSGLDVEALCKDLDGESPVGEDLEYDTEFVEMEGLANPSSEQSMVGESEAAVADWKGVRKLALGMFSRTRDLRVAVYLARASLACDGLTGFRDSLAVINGLLEQRWDDVHPQLDPDDDNDPTMRVNTIATLCDKANTLDLLIAAPLVEEKMTGRFGLREVQIANGDMPAPASMENPPTMALISAAFQQCELADLEAVGEALGESEVLLKSIDAVLTDKVGSASAADLSDLGNMLKLASGVVAPYLAERGIVAEEEGEEGEAGGAAKAQAISGEINSREDVRRMMDKIINYYRSHEPSSPIPLLIMRAKRLTTMDFMDILEDIAADGVAQARSIAGKALDDEV